MSKELKSIIGARVRAARRGANLSQAQLAEAVDRTVEAISNIERGRSLPPLDLLARIGETTGQSLAMLVAVPEQATGLSERAGLEVELLAAGQKLPLEQLRVAVAQIKAFERQE